MSLLFFFAFALVLPTAIIISRNGDVLEVLPMLASGIGFALLLYALVNLFKRWNGWLAMLAGVILLTLFMAVRYLLGFLYDFSGRGFSADFFAHINPTAWSVALQEYGKEGLVGLIIFSVFAWLTARLIRRHQPHRPISSLVLLPLAALLIYSGASASPEIQFAQAYARYTQPRDMQQNMPLATIREQSQQLLAPLRRNRALPVEKAALEVSVPDRPLNLILVYVESFNETLVNHPQYPGLTPRIDALKQRLLSFEQIHSSSYVTIEGIANSQCGTLMDMEYANSSLINRRGRLTELPCLGDILRQGGYHQTYLGGASLGFAGKGPFLRDHGYDRTLGWEHWDDKGYARFNDWGLSDTILFDEALQTIKAYRAAGKPYNVTLLTLGMHAPGFLYDECPVYTEDADKPFVNAVHCTDYLLGSFVNRLEAQGILDDTVLFIQADHGSFITPDIMRQFGKSVVDTRLLTLMSIPESASIPADKLRLNAEGSNLDVVATLLDVMDITHNSSFIFSRSHFQAEPLRDYYLTRRQDYQRMQRIENDRYRCADPGRGGNLNLPLDNCDKDRVMTAINQLNLTYARNEGEDNEICTLSASVYFEADTRKVKIKWGNQNLTGQFYRKGTRRHKRHIEGIYAVLLDENNTVQRNLFFWPTEVEDMRDIRELYLKAEDGERILLLHNLEMDTLSPEIRNAWPEQLKQQSLVYGEFKGGRLIPEFVSHVPLSSLEFRPRSCDN